MSAHAGGKPTQPVTALLSAVGGGDAAALAQLWNLVYDELRGVAHRQLAGDRPADRLQTTILVHEAYCRLVGDEPIQWANRRHFFAAAARAMRQIRVDDARRRGRQKRGGGVAPTPLDHEPGVCDADPAEILALEEALTRLEQLDPQKAELVMLRYFAGLTIDETAAALGLAPRTVDKEWRFARAWLHRALSDGDTATGS